MSDAMKEAIAETNSRRERQAAHNREHGITPKTIVRAIKGIEIEGRRLGERPVLVPAERIAGMDKSAFDRLVKDLEAEMQRAAREWDFERAALLRDEILELKSKGAPKDEPSERQKEAIGHVEEKVGPRSGKKPMQVARRVFERSGAFGTDPDSGQSEAEPASDEDGTGNHAAEAESLATRMARAEAAKKAAATRPRKGKKGKHDPLL
jgi:hypothetical protein